MSVENVDFNELGDAAEFAADFFEPEDYEWGEIVDANDSGLVQEIPVEPHVLDEMADFQVPGYDDQRIAVERLDVIIEASSVTQLQLDTVFDLYGMNGDPKAQVQVADERDITRSAVEQMEWRTLKNLRIGARKLDAAAKVEHGQVASFDFYKKHLDRYHSWAAFMADVPPEQHALYKKAAEVFDMSSRDVLNDTKKVQLPPDVLDPLISHRLIRTVSDMLHQSNSILSTSSSWISHHRGVYVIERAEARNMARRGIVDTESLRQSLVSEFGPSEQLYRLYERIVFGDIADPKIRAAKREVIVENMKRYLA